MTRDSDPPDHRVGEALRVSCAWTAARVAAPLVIDRVPHTGSPRR